MATVKKIEGFALKEIKTIGGIPVGGGSGSLFESLAVGILPEVAEGYANSEFTLNFESSAVGALSE